MATNESVVLKSAPPISGPGALRQGDEHCPLWEGGGGVGTRPWWRGGGGGHKAFAILLLSWHSAAPINFSPFTKISTRPRPTRVTRTLGRVGRPAYAQPLPP